MSLQQMIREQELMLAKIAELEREIRDNSAARQIYSSRTLEEMDGKKKNWEEVLELDFVQGSTAEVRDRFTHSASSMFVVTKVSAFWREDVEGRWRPPSSVPDQEQAPAVVNGIDFLWTIQEGGANYSWMPEPMPSPLLQGSWERPFYLPIAGQVTTSMTIHFIATPTRPPAEDGTLVVVLGGYLLLDPPPEQQ